MKYEYLMRYLLDFGNLIKFKISKHTIHTTVMYHLLVIGGLWGWTGCGPWEGIHTLGTPCL